MKQINDFTISEFLDILKSKAPTPGGGAVAALTAANAAALLSMSANFTADNEKYAEYDSAAKEVIAETAVLIEELKSLAAADMAAFQCYTDATMMKKETDEEKACRRTAMQGALVDCMCVPLKIAETAYNILKIAENFAPKCNPNLVSDVSVANDLAIAAFNSAVTNVKINMKYIKDADVLADAENKLSAFSNADKLHENTRKITSDIMGF